MLIDANATLRLCVHFFATLEKELPYSRIRNIRYTYTVHVAFVDGEKNIYDNFKFTNSRVPIHWLILTVSLENRAKFATRTRSPHVAKVNEFYSYSYTNTMTIRILLEPATIFFQEITYKIRRGIIQTPFVLGTSWCALFLARKRCNRVIYFV